MLRVPPRLREDLRRFRCLSLRGKDPSGDGCGRDERRRKLESLSRIGERFGLLSVFELDGELRQQKGAPPVGFAFSKMTVLLGDLERLERGSPIAFAALHFEKRARRPAQRRVGGEGALGKLLGRFDLPGLFRLDEKPPETEFSHLRLLEHALEGLTGRNRIFVELRGLGFEKKVSGSSGAFFFAMAPGFERGRTCRRRRLRRCRGAPPPGRSGCGAGPSRRVSRFGAENVRMPSQPSSAKTAKLKNSTMVAMKTLVRIS